LRRTVTSGLTLTMSGYRPTGHGSEGFRV
jgi:hypothetical protein